MGSEMCIRDRCEGVEIVCQSCVHWHGGKVRLYEAEVVERLVHLRIGRALEEPHSRDSNPGPFPLNALESEGRPPSLLLRGDSPETRGDMLWGSIAVHFGDPDRLLGIPVGHHHVSYPHGAREVDVP